jgi:soluble lytic murein transglycosylase-like protein
MHIRTLALMYGLFSASGIAMAQIYAGTTDEGTTILSDFVSHDARRLIIAASEGMKDKPNASNRKTSKRVVIPAALRPIIEEAAKQSRLDPNLLHAVITVESGYNVRAVSPKGASGLMQLKPATARRFGAKDIFDPRENIQAGARYLGWLLNFFQGDIELALAGYNAGEQAVVRAGYRIPDFGETRTFVPTVLMHYTSAVND